jgi:hypothetical protein
MTPGLSQRGREHYSHRSLELHLLGPHETGRGLHEGGGEGCIEKEVGSFRYRCKDQQERVRRVAEWGVHCTKNPSYVFPEMKSRGLVPSSYIHVSVSDLYIWLQQKCICRTHKKGGVGGGGRGLHAKV